MLLVQDGHMVEETIANAVTIWATTIINDPRKSHGAIALVAASFGSLEARKNVVHWW